MSVKINLIGLVVIASRVVHNHDKGALNLLVAENFFGKRHRCVSLCFGLGNTFFVGESVIKLRWRLTEDEAKHAIDISKHACLLRFYGSLFLSGSNHITQDQTIFA